jgi:hypothetical protein
MYLLATRLNIRLPFRYFTATNQRHTRQVECDGLCCRDTDACKTAPPRLGAVRARVRLHEASSGKHSSWDRQDTAAYSQ